MRDKWIVDFKTSKNGAIYPEWELQLAAYSGLKWNIDREDIRKVGILLLDKETGIPSFHDCSNNLELNWDAFMHLREYFRIREEPYRELKKFYPYQDKKFPSVTAVLEVLQKPALIQWAANETRDYFKENLPLIRNPETKDEAIDYLFKQSNTAFRRASKTAMDIGTVVHGALEAYLSGIPEDKLELTTPQAQQAFKAFKEWKEAVQLEPIATECQLIDAVSETGGTCDFIGYLTLNKEEDHGKRTAEEG